LLDKFKVVLVFLRRADTKLRGLVEDSPIFFVTIALAMLVVLFFRNIVELLLQGLFFAALALIVIACAFIVWLKATYRPSMEKVLREKNTLVKAIAIAREMYMRRKLDKEEFNKFFIEKQKQLIEVEVLIEQMRNRYSNKGFGRELLAVRGRKKHFLKGLLNQKKSVLKQLELVEKSYLKRKIDAKTYQNLLEVARKKFIEIEAVIQNFHREESASEALRKKKKRVKKKKQLPRKEREALKMGEEIFSQLPKKKQ